MCLLHKQPRGSQIPAEMKRVKLKFQFLSQHTQVKKTIGGILGMIMSGCASDFMLCCYKSALFYVNMWVLLHLAQFLLPLTPKYSLAFQLYVPFPSAATCNFSLRCLVQWRLYTLYQSSFTGKQWAVIQYKKSTIELERFHIMPLHSPLNHCKNVKNIDMNADRRSLWCFKHLERFGIKGNWMEINWTEFCFTKGQKYVLKMPNTLQNVYKKIKYT